jgi:hypothetical protein
MKAIRAMGPERGVATVSFIGWELLHSNEVSALSALNIGV